ncbi:hypothetical protein [Oceanisphaera sp. IT1-181]|uniref:hypothetical protein n=1 Tax=Oceanisphaera sp. IT1-181 TaxID=3081199 RepID=UPI0029CA1128|nr:hypothetical protein [Oceanisphaera sp. IT1-181]
MDLNLAIRRHARQRGSMLISVIFIILVMGALMAGLATLSNQSSQQLVYEVQAFKARLAAESILEKQIFVSLANISAPKVAVEGTPAVINGCDAYIKSIDTDGETLTKQINISATAKCESDQLTVIRNIEVEVIK